MISIRPVRASCAIIAALILGLPARAAEPEEPPRPPPVARVEDAVVFSINESVQSPREVDLARRSGSDLLIRACFKWNHAPHLDPRLPEQVHGLGALFGGGITCSVFFEGENGLSPAQVADMATRGVDGEPVDWPTGARKPPYGHHGSLSSPAYLDYLFRWCREQIDAGADSLFMDESENYLLPNEGFDEHSVRDFARFLLEENPVTKGWLPNDVRWTVRFNIDLRDPHFVPSGLISSFDYRAYLQNLGLQKSADARNPLAEFWPLFLVWRDRHSWQILTERIRAYAREKGRQVSICGNGLVPFVDLQVTNNWKEDEEMERAKKIDLSKSGLPLWRAMVEQGRKIAGKPVPVVVFHDWGAPFPWMAVTPAERNAWSRTRGAEIYAAGGFYAFPVMSPHGYDSGKDGTIETISREAAFYRAHRDLYLRGQFLSASTVRTEAPDLSLAVWITDDPHVLVVHAINRQWVDAQLQLRHNPVVSLPLDRLPESAKAFSPDWNDQRTADCKLTDGQLDISLGELDAHAIIELRFKDAVSPAELARLGDRK